MACEVVGMLELVVYKYDQVLQPFDVEETGGQRGATRDGGKPLEDGEKPWVLISMHCRRW